MEHAPEALREYEPASTRKLYAPVKSVNRAACAAPDSVTWPPTTGWPDASRTCPLIENAPLVAPNPTCRCPPHPGPLPEKSLVASAETLFKTAAFGSNLHRWNCGLTRYDPGCSPPNAYLPSGPVWTAAKPSSSLSSSSSPWGPTNLTLAFANPRPNASVTVPE